MREWLTSYNKKKPRVTLWPMEVKGVEEEWEEQNTRERRWVSAEQVREMVKNKRLLAAFEEILAYLEDEDIV